MAEKNKSTMRLLRFDELEFLPRFEYADMAEVVQLCGPEDGTELGVGFVRLRQAYIPWTIQYDEVLTVIEGELKLHANAEVLQLKARDSIWLPAATELVYEAESALVLFAIHPAGWNE